MKMGALNPLKGLYFIDFLKKPLFFKKWNQRFQKVLSFGVLYSRIFMEDQKCKMAIQGKTTKFTCYKECGWTGFLVGLTTAILFEGIAFQIMLKNSYPNAVLAHTALIFFTIVWLSRDFKALKSKPIEINDHTIKIRLGRRCQFELPFDCIKTVKNGPPKECDVTSVYRKGEFIKKPVVPGYIPIALTNMINVHLVLNDPTPIKLGFRNRSVDRIGLCVDQPEDFLKLMRNKLSASPLFSD